ncbi:uncharacterized protein CDAR_451351 [Caerostris darwini]|uniref:Uncharacterized protein n=1 Tax=Caerostris darwini TaxID=1538125 RepID=A0AAV4SHG7_9ARAC|nr:uncharacterized protein CDAR_451351 [Caerostris darwini]
MRTYFSSRQSVGVMAEKINFHSNSALAQSLQSFLSAVPLSPAIDRACASLLRASDHGRRLSPAIFRKRESEDPPIQKPRLPHSPNGHPIEQFVNREFEKSRRRCLADDSARVNSPTPHRGQVLSGIKKCVRYDCVHLVRLPTMLGVCCGGGTSHSVSLDGLHAERGDERAPESPLVAPMDRPRSPWRRSLLLKQEESRHFVADGLDICSPRQYDRHIKRIKGQSSCAAKIISLSGTFVL